MKKEIPILFSTPMVQAILTGRKTQTRRIIKNLDGFEYNPVAARAMGISRDSVPLKPLTKNYLRKRIIRCPYGQPGDLLWVREKWTQNGLDYFRYAADWGDGKYETGEPKGTFLNKSVPENFRGKWKPSIHMPKEAARIWHEVTGIRVERIADISEEDCIAEGIHLQETGFYCWEPDLGLQFSARSAKEAFRKLWKLINGQPRPVQEKINGKIVTVAYEVYPFNEEDGKEFIGLTEWKGKPLTVCINPWVWVVEFKVLSTNGQTEFRSGQHRGSSALGLKQ